MKSTDLVLPAALLAGAGLVLAPAGPARGFTVLGGSLAAESQRDFRLHDDFQDPSANANTTIDPNFPGWVGADLACWKAISEWGSGPFGDGSGDPLQPNVGDGGANFDAFFAGEATSAGGIDDNVAAALQSGGGCTGGVIAYVQSPISDGWSMRFCDGSFVFYDGPGDNPSSGMDIQGIATHEYGHALGLGHSSVQTATMFPSTSGAASSDWRSIEPDDVAGVQSIYGVAAASKPRIDSVSVAGDLVTITGVNFSASDGEVWFASDLATAPALDPRVIVSDVASTDGGTRITVTVPAGATSGSVAVKQSGTGHETLSNAFPVDTGDLPGNDPDAGISASPTSGSAPLGVAFTDTSTGTGLSAWLWDFGDGASSTQEFPVHVYTVPGTYDVSLTVTGALGSNTEVDPALVVVDGAMVASCTDANGTGANPDVFTCTTTPRLGTTWTTQVDGTSLGATGLSFVLGFSRTTAPLPTTYGELLVDPTSTPLFSSATLVLGGIATHSLAVPDDPSLEGFQVHAQAYLAGPKRLTNRQDVVLGSI